MDTNPLESGKVDREAGPMVNPETSLMEWYGALRVCDCGRRATHTVFDPHNTMSYICDTHAQELMDEAAQANKPQDSDYGWIERDDWTDDLILVAQIEETSTERSARLTWQNLLPNGAYRR